MRFLCFIGVLLLFTIVKAVESETLPHVEYLPPVLGTHSFYDHFADLSQWTVSKHPKFHGKWAVEYPEEPAGIPNDKGLVVKTVAAHHGIFASLESPFEIQEEPLVLQYEVRYQKHPISCAGSYIKVLSALPTESDFSDVTPWSIMFGPDVCGRSQVHFIFRTINPKTGEPIEHHMINSPAVQNDGVTHLYTLVVDPKTNEYQVKVDDKEVSKGSLFTDFQPPVNPPAQIPDPSATKPDDWDEREFIVDQDAVKPIDWDEPEFIVDPEAKMPEDWDVEEDGDWSAPMIPNPEYKGEWVPPVKENPEYKGKWEAPLIDNPDYYEVTHPLQGQRVAALGIEIWSMDSGILFDNILLTSEEAVAKDLAKHTYHLKSKKEVKMAKEAQKKAADEAKKAAKESAGKVGVVGYLNELSGNVASVVRENPIVTIITAFAIALSTVILISRRKEKPVPSEEKSEESASESEVKSEVEVKEEEEEVVEEEEQERSEQVEKPILIQETVETIKEVEDVPSQTTQEQQEQVPEQVGAVETDDFTAVKTRKTGRRKGATRIEE
ncbi:hypothetical protein RCL1_007258 [Eukaryota sp. TZLM3-RCL]